MASTQMGAMRELAKREGERPREPRTAARSLGVAVASAVIDLAKWLTGALPAARVWVREYGGLAKVAALAAA